MKTPKRQMPQRPRCPICGSELDGESTDIDDFHDVFYVYCPEDGEHIITGNGGNISDKDYKKLEEAYLRWRDADEWRVIENGKYAIHARWKRKNREAQYKRTISKQQQIILALHTELCRIKAETLRNVADMRTILNGAQPYLDFMEDNGCQDIEGS